MNWQTPGTIKKVDELKHKDGKDRYGLSIEEEGESEIGFGFILDDYGITSKVGDTIRIKGNLGAPISGVMLNGKVLFDKTQEDLDREHAEWKETNELEKKAQFEKDKEQLDADYAALPAIFQKRIDRFRQNNPNFRWDIEGYVMFASKEAVKIINSCKTAEHVTAFGKLDYTQQKKIAGLDDGHSGGTFWEAMQLAYAYKENEAWVPFVHSSLAHIGGCETVGCLPPTEEEKKNLPKL